MKANKLPGLNLYHGGTVLSYGMGDGPVRICSYLPYSKINQYFRQKQASGEIEFWSIYQIDHKLAINMEIDDCWKFLDENQQLMDIEVLYIRQLSGI